MTLTSHPVYRGAVETFFRRFCQENTIRIRKPTWDNGGLRFDCAARDRGTAELAIKAIQETAFVRYAYSMAANADAGAPKLSGDFFADMLDRRLAAISREHGHRSGRADEVREEHEALARAVREECEASARAMRQSGRPRRAKAKRNVRRTTRAPSAIHAAT